MKKVMVFFFIILFSCLIYSEVISVGAKDFTEGYILGNMIYELLEEKGYDVKLREGLASFQIRQSLLADQLDIYSEYTGTAWAAYFKHEKRIYDPVKLFNKVAEEDLKKNNIKWINRIPLNDTYALAIRKEFAEKNDLKTLSDLATFINENKNKKISFGVSHEFYQRNDGFFAMAEKYNMNLDKNQVKTMSSGLTYKALDTGKIDVAMVYSTKALLLKFNLKVLEDNKNFFPTYNPAILVRKEIYDEYPGIENALKPLTKYLNEEIIIRLNYLVDVEGFSPRNVARNYLKGLGLIEK